MFYYVLPDGTVLSAKTAAELAQKIKEYREGTS